MRPNTALTSAASSDAPKLKRYAASAAGDGDGVPELRPRQRAGFGERRRQRNQHDQAQIKQREAERQIEARQHSALAANVTCVEVLPRSIVQLCPTAKPCKRQVDKSGRTCRRRRNASFAPSAQPPNSWSTVTSFNWLKLAAYFAAMASLRGR